MVNLKTCRSLMSLVIGFGQIKNHVKASSLMLLAIYEAPPHQRAAESGSAFSAKKIQKSFKMFQSCCIIRLPTSSQMWLVCLGYWRGSDDTLLGGLVNCMHYALRDAIIFVL